MTTRDTDSSEWGNASVFNHRGQRVNEIDLDARTLPQTIAEMADEDWQRAADLLREFDQGTR